VGVNLGRHDAEYDYMPDIVRATDDIDVSLIFNNAGYLVLKVRVVLALDLLLLLLLLLLMMMMTMILTSVDDMVAMKGLRACGHQQPAHEPRVQRREPPACDAPLSQPHGREEAARLHHVHVVAGVVLPCAVERPLRQRQGLPVGLCQLARHRSRAYVVVPSTLAPLQTESERAPCMLTHTALMYATAYGIDVLCLMPGPMNTNFTKGLPELEALKFFCTLPMPSLSLCLCLCLLWLWLCSFSRYHPTDSISSSPEQVAEIMFKSIGKLTWRDASLYTAFTRLVIKFVDMNLLVGLIAKAQKFTPDYRNHPELR